MRVSKLVALALCAALGACANLNTVARQTPLPPEGSTGVAVHLDAQQRLLIYSKNGQYCAEPSPDAMAAYAASLGLSASVPSEGGGSASQAMQSAAANIGLRTQSITLMRDALYRLCEAHANGTLTPFSATQLMARSQDLTAVVVATEQLTGAVAANQAILSGAASSSASASLVANQQLLDAQRQSVADKQKSLDDATKAAADQQTIVTAKQTALQSAQAAAAAPPAGSDVTALQAAAAKAQTDYDTENRKLADAKTLVATRQAILDDAKTTLQTIQDNRDAALTAATASASTTGQFSTPAQRNQLSKDSTDKIAEAVQAMVLAVLEKDYSTDACMTLLTANPDTLNARDPRGLSLLSGTRSFCMNLIGAKAEANARAITTRYMASGLTDKINKALAADAGLRAKLSAWLKTNSPGTSVTDLLYGSDDALKQRAIAGVPIP